MTNVCSHNYYTFMFFVDTTEFNERGEIKINRVKAKIPVTLKKAGEGQTVYAGKLEFNDTTFTSYKTKGSKNDWTEEQYPPLKLKLRVK